MDAIRQKVRYPMKVIIDIDEDEYEFCKGCVDSELPKEMTTIDIVAYKVGNGTLLSEEVQYIDKALNEGGE